MRTVAVLFKGEVAGYLTQADDGSFTFEYQREWIANPAKPGISLTLPKQAEPYTSSFLFPLFFNMLPEGSNKQVVCHYNRIDPDDYFGILIATANEDTIGAISVRKIGGDE